MILAWAIIATLLVFGLAWYAVKVTKQNLQLNDQREELVDVIEESLDMLDDCYTSIARAAEIPVLSDEPIIRDLLSDIKRAKNAVLQIAGRVVIYGDDKRAEGDE